MANKNFVVHNGLTVGPLTIFAANGSITTTGTVGGTFTANAATLTGTTLNATVVASSLTSVGNLTSLNASGNISTTGSVVAAKFYGDGSGLTGVTSYTNSDLATALASGTTTIANVTVSGKVVGNLIPSANITYTLGDLTHQWKDLYVGPGSIYVNGNKVLEQQSDTIIFSADPNQNIAIRTTGTGDIEINPANTGVIAFKGAVQFDDAYNFSTTSGNAVPFSVGLKASGITAYGTNATLTLAGTGTGSISLNDDVTVTGNLTVNGTTAALNVTNLNVQDNIINISSGATGAPSANAGLQVIRGDDPNVQLRWNESVDKWQFTNDGSTYANLVSGTDITTVGNITSGTWSGSVIQPAYIATLNQNTTGSAASLTTSRNINGVAFNGTADITVTANAATLTGTTLASGVTASSLTSVGTLGSLTVTNAATVGSVVAGNISISATADAITSSGTLTLDPNPTGSGGLVVIQGNLQVTGTTTTVNSTTVEVADLNITLAKDAATAAAANGAGLTVAGASATFNYASTGDKWASNKPLDVTGNVVATAFSGSGAYLTSIPNGALTNSSVTVNGTAVSLGGTATVTANAATLTGTTLNATVVASSLTSVGNITSGTWSGSVIQPAYIATLNQNTTGSAASLTTSRNINGVAFNGTADITVTANAATLTGATLASGVTASSLTSVGTLSALTVSGAITVNSGNNVTAIVNGGTNGTGNIGASGQTFNTIFAKATTAQYADLAEKYAADAEYEPGTVLCFGGSAEVTECDHDADRKVAGVVTTNPAYMMNDAIDAEHSAAIALQGRVPCKVVGPVAKGDMLVSAGAGRARAEADPKVGSVIGKALEAHAEGEGVIEVAVGRF